MDNYIHGDLYSNGINGFSNFDIPDDIQVIFIDAVHQHLEVGYDTLNTLKRFKNCYIIYDDYSKHEPVRKAIDQFLNANILEFISNVGHDCEGVICKSTDQTQLKINLQ